ncbi:UNVERIFIED_CONTAM: Retrovirus-related Pol polyprotein from transposon TNT 1-94 [Sesamum radiatum]|uniref:Retrovirus-related Pol polyprotein from transposon TNT 1-94 n=1 Tax=Sesamum radiatum TaxID=300843 RepID=A0AAW2R1Y8_SESRA
MLQLWGKGHFIKDCKKLKKKNQNESANAVDENNGEVYMICDVNAVNLSANMNEWLVDSGCTFHMTPFKEILTNYKSEKFGSVSMANEKLCEVHGYGDVCLIFENGFKITLKNVHYVPDLCHNLISCAALQEEGLEGRWGKGIMKIMKGSLTIFKAEKKRNLYFCHVKYDLLAASVKHSKTSDLWHKRLGHMSAKGLDLLHKQGMIKDKCDNMSFCDDCILGKHHKVQFPSSSQKPSSSSCILDYVHADVWGPANVPTHGGNSSGLSKSFWGDALMTAAYLINRSPSVPLSGKVSECVWTDSDVDLSSLRIFGCSAFALQNGDKLDLEPKNVCLLVILMGLKVIGCGLGTNQDNQQGEEIQEEENQPRVITRDNTEHHNNDYQLARDRVRRETRIPSRFRDFDLALNVEDLEPLTYEEALGSKNSEQWKQAMNEEMESLRKNNT